MGSLYKYKSSANYIKRMRFDYIETYSFQRGDQYQEGQEVGEIQYLINNEGEFHPSSKKTGTFLLSDPIAAKLISILSIKAREIPRFLCSPFFRDAIVFYDKKHRIISVLNICLSCLQMETKKFHHIDSDFETYDLVKRLLLEIGHDVENPTAFPLDEIKRLTGKEYPRR